MYETWLRTLTYVELQSLRTAVDREMQKRRDNARPADTRERTGKGRMFLATGERR